MKSLRFGARAFIAIALFGLIFAAAPPPTADAQGVCLQLHAEDYEPVADYKCGNWILQHMTHEKYNPRYGANGWQINDKGSVFVLVNNYSKSGEKLNFGYFKTIDYLILVERADLRVGKARPLHEDRVDPELDQNAVGLYIEQSHAEMIGAMIR